jgi:hypothetical protein
MEQPSLQHRQQASRQVPEEPHVEQEQQVIRQQVIQQEVPQQQAAEAQTQTAAGNMNGDWILCIRTPRLCQRENPSLPTILRIHVSHNMSATTLAACISQALYSHPTRFPAAQDENHYMVGLFVQRTGIFVTLQHLLEAASTDSATDVYCVHLEPRPPPPKPVEWWERPPAYIAAAVVLVALVAWLWFLQMHLSVLPALERAAVGAYSWTIHSPLTELYRHGPWFLGWEGESLPRICSRITYHGDFHFWSRNIEECQRIFNAKQEAFLRLARPIVYAFLTLVMAVVIRFILWEQSQHKLRLAAAGRPTTDRDMVETYRAFQVLMRQAGRALAPPAAPEQHQQPARGGDPRHL